MKVQHYKLGSRVLGISTSTFFLRRTATLVLASVTAPVTARTIDVITIFGTAFVRAMTGLTAL